MQTTLSRTNCAASLQPEKFFLPAFLCRAVQKQYTQSPKPRTFFNAQKHVRLHYSKEEKNSDRRISIENVLCITVLCASSTRLVDSMMV